MGFFGKNDRKLDMRFWFWYCFSQKMVQGVIQSSRISKYIVLAHISQNFISMAHHLQQFLHAAARCNNYCTDVTPLISLLKLFFLIEKSNFGVWLRSCILSKEFVSLSVHWAVYLCWNSISWVIFGIQR